MKKYITAQEAADMLGVHHRTLKRKARLGEIPGTRMGRIWKFDPTRIENWMQKRIDKQVID